MNLYLTQAASTGTGVEWLVGVSLLAPILVLIIILILGGRNTV